MEGGREEERRCSEVERDRRGEVRKGKLLVIYHTCCGHLADNHKPFDR